MTGATNLPALSNLISRDWIPRELSIVDEAIDVVLSKLRYRDLLIERSSDNVTGYYGLTLVTRKLEVDLLGSGLKLIFFPPADPDAPDSEFPVSFEYRWAILRYLGAFETLSFAGTGKAFFEIFLELVDITEVEFLTGVVEAFISDPAPYQALVDSLRQWQGGGSPLADLTLANPPVGYTEIEYIIQQMTAANVDVFEAVFEAVIEDLNDLDASVDKLTVLFQGWLGVITRDEIEQLLVPQFSLALRQVPMVIEAPRSVLIPLNDDNEPFADEARHSRLTFKAGGVRYDSAAGFAIDIDGTVSASFDKSVIPRIGLTLEFDDIKIDLSRTANIAEADAEGRPADFMGVFIGNALIGLPRAWFESYQPTADPVTLGVVGRNLLIGTGGLSGTLGLEAIAAGKPKPAEDRHSGPDELEFVLGKPVPAGQERQGFVLGFSTFDMTFRQNRLLDSHIEGSLTVPGFDNTPPQPNSAPANKIGIKLFLDGDGDFEITASVAGGHLFTVPDIFTFNATSLSVGKDDHGAFLRATGDLSFANNAILGPLLRKPIHLEKLLIHSDGSIELEGGVVPLPESAVIAIGPARIAITAIHFGSHEQEHGGVMRKYRYWGFDGGVSVDPGGVDARGDGICFYYSVDDLPRHTFLRIDGIGIDLVIPGSASKEEAVLLLQGYLALKDPVYQGSLKFQLPQVKIAGGAAMKYDTRHPAWIVRVDLELPRALPLGATGLGIYSFAGLFGLRYVASKQAVSPPLPADASWGDYYRAPPRGVDVGKFETPEKTAGSRNPFSVGVGVGLCTASDNGKVFSAQLFLLVSLPNLIMLEGRGDVLAKKRVSIVDDPPYYAYLALSPGESIEMGVGVNYLIPKDTGKVLNLTAVLQAAFFFRNASAWYVNFGTRDKPASARIIDMFDGYAYLMLSASGIETGAGVSFDFNKTYGPIGVDAHAYLDFWAYISFERTQAGGGIAMGGYLDVTLFRFGFNISLAAALTMEAPKPYYVAGSVEVCVSVKLLKKKITKCCTLSFVWQTPDSMDTSPVQVMTQSGPPAVSAVHMVSGSTYEVAFSTSGTPPANPPPPIPLDCFIDVKFTKPVNPSSAVGPLIGGYTSAPVGDRERMPPRYGKSIATHAYSLEKVALEVLRNGSWVDYHPYAALAPDGLLDASVVQQLSDMPVGVWQKQNPEYNQIRFLALTPFSWMGPMVGYRPEEMGVTPRSTYCVGRKREKHCATWTDQATYVTGLDYLRDGLMHRVDGDRTAAVALDGPQLQPVSLAIGPSGVASFQFLDPVVECNLTLFTTAPSVTIRWQRRKPVAVNGVVVRSPQAPPEFEDVGPALIVPHSAAAEVIQYHQPTDPIDRIVLETPAPDLRKIAQLKETIARRGDDWIRSPAERDAIAAEIADLSKALQAEHDRTCIAGAPTGRPGDGGDEGQGRKETRALNAERKRLREILKGLLDRYQTSCADVAADGHPGEPTDPGVRELLGLPRIKPASDRKAGPASPRLSSERCCTLARAIAEAEIRLRDIDHKLEAANGSGDGVPAGAGDALPPDWTCGTFVGEVCWLTREDDAYNQSLPGLDAIAADFSMMRSAVEGAIAPIWRPGETYRIQLRTYDTVCGVKSQPMDYYIHFRTDGPIGHFTVPPSPTDSLGPPPGPDTSDKRQEVPERSLRFYIDMQRSYPDPGGALLYAKPLYYKDVELRLFFDKPHAYHFFADWPGAGRKYALELAVKDPAEAAPPGPNAAPHEAGIALTPHLGAQSWLTDTAPKLDQEFKVLEAFRTPVPDPDGGGDSLVCLAVGGDPIAPLSKVLHVEIASLKPDKLYTAVVLNRRTDQPETAEVHRYPFRTSRYADFASHIASCRLQGEGDVARLAVFNVDHSLPGAESQTRAAALALVSGGAASDVAAYPDPFDGLIFGLLQLPPLAPATTVEFNFVTSNGGPTFGLWIRGPEPLYDPRLPAPTLAAAIGLLENGASRPVKVLMSRDRSQAFLMVPAGAFPTQNLAVRFASLTWDGQPASPASVDTDVFSRT